ncbi:MAG: OmpA family protein [Lachnospiraceae bacterium]|nr:OmpA family protein [Lachnospiraceae bacterium]
MKTTRIFVAVMMLISVLGVFTSCGTSSPIIPINTAIVLPFHMGCARPSEEVLVQIISDSVKTKGDIYLITNEGHPNATKYSVSYKTAGMSSTAVSNSQHRAEKEVLKLTSTLGAQTEELDTLGAIDLAALSLKATDNGGKSKLILLDSGLSTKHLDMRTCPISEIDIEETVATLKENQALSDLSEIDEFSFEMLGTSGDQKAPTNQEKAVLVELWRSVVSGFGCENFTNSFVTDTSKDKCLSYPTVSVVECGSEQGGIQQRKSSTTDVPLVEEHQETQQVEIHGVEPIYIGVDDVRFEKNTADLADIVAAESIISSKAEILKKTDIRVLVVGMTANYGERDTSLELSCSRAEKICDMLVSQGVSKERLYAIGLGYEECPLRYADDDMNRCVVLLDMDSEDAQECLEVYERLK